MKNQTVEPLNNAVKHWYLSLIMGVFFIFFGIWVIQTPLESYLALSVLFSLTFFLNGVTEIFYFISNRLTVNHWGFGLAFGIVDLLFGIWLISSPQVSIQILPFVVGFVLLFRSATAIGVAFDLKERGIHDWWLVLIISLFAMFFSFAIIFNPVLGGMTLVMLTAMALLSYGIFRIFLAFKLKQFNDSNT